MTTRRKLENSVVVLTGASSGVGRAAALEFARRGAKLVLAARDAAALEEISRECRSAFGVETLAVPTDVRDEAAVDRLAEAAIETFGRIDTWVNDAAVYLMGRFDAVPSAAIRELFDTNVMGVVHGT